MLNVAIVEDELAAREKLKQFLSQYGRELRERFNITCYQNPLAFLAQEHQKYDIVFMDILMPHMNGLEAARAFRKRDNNAILLFVTNTAQFAVSGYEVHALDYIVKPVEYTSFCRKIGRAVSYAQRNVGKEIILSKADGLIRIPHRSIRYLTIKDHLVYFYTEDGIHDFWGTLAGFENKLAPYGFLRCHSRYIVNPAHIRKVNGLNLEMSDGMILQISNAKKKKFMEDLTTWLGENT